MFLVYFLSDFQCRLRKIPGQIYATFHPVKLGLPLENCIVIRSGILGK